MDWLSLIVSSTSALAAITVAFANGYLAHITRRYEEHARQHMELTDRLVELAQPAPRLVAVWGWESATGAGSQFDFLQVQNLGTASAFKIRMTGATQAGDCPEELAAPIPDLSLSFGLMPGASGRIVLRRSSDASWSRAYQVLFTLQYTTTDGRELIEEFPISLPNAADEALNNPFHGQGLPMAPRRA